jgi:hypothetical protein
MYEQRMKQLELRQALNSAIFKKGAPPSLKQH